MTPMTPMTPMTRAFSGVLVLTIAFGGGVAAQAQKSHPATATVNEAAVGQAQSVPFREPQEIEVGDDPTMLYVQFAAVEVPQEHADGSVSTETIWTRAYGLEPKTDLIPGPTFRFQPGDFLQLTLNNIMDPEKNKELFEFDESVDPVFDTDEIAHHVSSEINIPHNPNNTNLHTHGLHVDPDKDDVTLIVIPEGDDKLNYDPSLWPYIREQIWPYQYRIPEIHLPGTHWYHAHKHGSTSIHVENGMAGAFVIAPPDGQPDIVPGLSAADDQVMVIQEIANYGIQQGIGKGLTNRKNAGDLTLADDDSGGASGELDPNPQATGVSSRLITVNGQVQPTLTLAPGQLQRWRLINAASNHRSFSYIWAARLVDTQTSKQKLTSGTGKGKSVQVTTYTYQEVPLHLAAIDGITLKATVPVTAQKPLFMGPGNRADVLFQAQDPGSYALFKNFPASAFNAAAGSTAPQTVIRIVDGAGKTVTPAAAQDQISNPYLLHESAGATEPNFGAFKVNWIFRSDTTGKRSGINVAQKGQTTMIPILRLVPDGGFLDLSYATEFPSVGWQPVHIGDVGGGATDNQLLMEVEVGGEPVDGPGLPSAAHMASVSPTGTMKPPAYVSPVEDSDVLQSRTALFDFSGVFITVQPKDASDDVQSIRQFTLNGRQFNLDDSIGNPDAVDFINDPPDVPATASHGTQDLTVNCVDHHGLWINQHWVNPGYYKKIHQVEFDSHQAYEYVMDEDEVALGGQTCVPPKGAPKITYKDVTGLDRLAVVNAGYPGAADVARIPGLPVATTAEEWVLVNNSPMGHPFHIHINPFFITEIGQLSYEGFKGSKACGNKKAGAADGMAWVIRTVGTQTGEPGQDACTMDAPTTPTKLRGTSTMGWMVGNWWDTIVIPPHGYVKMRYWMNVPQQTGDGQEVFDDVNRAGDWVYHCHILRHEDRGMMMLVGTQPKQKKAGEMSGDGR